jgi:hypothetical protein
MLVSKDRTQTAILVGVYPFANRTALTQRIKSVAVSSPLSVSVTGLPIISEEVMGWANSRMYIMLMVLVILLCIIYIVILALVIGSKEIIQSAAGSHQSAQIAARQVLIFTSSFCSLLLLIDPLR